MKQQLRYLPKNTLTKITETNDGDSRCSSILPEVMIAPQEAEQMVEALRPFTVEEIGSSEFLKMYACTAERLCIQAHSSAAVVDQGNEYIVEAILRHGKLTTLVETLLAMEVWRTQVLPLLLEKMASQNALRCAFILHVETTILSLINLCLFQRHGVEALNDERADASIALVDYTSRCLVQLATPLCQNPMVQRQKQQQQQQQQQQEKIAEDNTAALQDTILDTYFVTCVASVTTARYLTEYMDALPLSAQSRILDTHDFLLLMIPLVEEPPWTRKTSTQPSRWEKLVDYHWEAIPTSDLLQITQCEAQPWLTLYFITCPVVTPADCHTSSCERYALTSYRKDQLLRLRRYLNDMLLDQLPVLADLCRFMDELSLMDVTSAVLTPNVFLLQPVDTLRENLLLDQHRCSMNWSSVANIQWEKYFHHITDATDKDLKRIVEEVYYDSSMSKEEKTEQQGKEHLLLPVRSVHFTSSSSDHIVVMEPASISTATVVPTALGNFRRFQLAFPTNYCSSAFSFSALELETTKTIITALVTFISAQSKPITTTLSNQLLLVPKEQGKKKQWFQLGSVHEGIILQLGFATAPIRLDNNAALTPSNNILFSLEQVFISQPE